MSAVVELEDLIGTQLLLASIGVGSRPRVAERYEILELRGRGARGLVCRVTDLKLGRDVALKIYPPVGDARLEAEVVREARSLARLEHVNVVRVIDFGNARVDVVGRFVDVVFLCMEFVEGRSLRAWCAERVRTPAEILHALHAAGTGLAAAHGAGIVHRDFKPENVMIDVRGRVCVVDFGLASGAWSQATPDGAPARENGWSAHSDRLTQLGIAIGTLEYMAPEARRGAADVKSDQFSFAMAAWECLTGVLPYDVHNAEWRVAGQHEFVGARTLPNPLRVVLERALAYLPKDRFPGMVALLHAMGTARGARARLAVGLFAGAGLLLLAGAATALTRGEWMNGAGNAELLPSTGATPLPAVDGEAARCGEIVGSWTVEVVVRRGGVSARYYDLQAHYSVLITARDAPCEMDVTVEKVGENGRLYPLSKVKSGKTPATAEAKGDVVTLSIAAEIELPDGKGQRPYQFELEFANGEVRGDWSTRFKPFDRGVAFGSRGARKAAKLRSPPSFSEQPCRSQCRILCAEEVATGNCYKRRCTVPGPVDVGHCGAPTAAFSAAENARSNLFMGAAHVRAALRVDDLCEKLAAKYVGTWSVWTAGLAEPRELELDHVGCDLRGTLSDAAGKKTSIDGAVDKYGAWVLAFDVETWSVMGGNPALGLDSIGRSMAAYKVDAGAGAPASR